jgi:hypothetical protein
MPPAQSDADIPRDIPQTPPMMPRHILCPGAPVKRNVIAIMQTDIGDPNRKVVRRLNFDLCQ